MMKKMPDVLMWIFLICFFIIIIIIGIDSVFECLSWFVRAFTNKECSFERFALITLTISGFIYYFIYSAKNKYGWYLILHTRAKRIAKRARSLVPDGSDLAFYLSFGEYLRLRSKSIADGPLLLSGYTGQRVVKNFRVRDYYPLLDRMGIARRTPHATRHTYASWARRAGVTPEVLQKILGHSDYSTTANIYVHTDVEELVKAVENC